MHSQNYSDELCFRTYSLFRQECFNKSESVQKLNFDSASPYVNTSMESLINNQDVFEQ